MGDAAHACTPHQGQGAGMAFEDSWVLSEVLGRVLNGDKGEVGDMRKGEIGDNEGMKKGIECCLHAYDEIRRPRTQEMTRTSREMGVLLGFGEEGARRDVVKIKGDLDGRMGWIWDVDLRGEVDRGLEIARTKFRVEQSMHGKQQPE